MGETCKSPEDLLAVAARLRELACPDARHEYSDRLERCALDLEMEALGWAASPTIAQEVRHVRRTVLPRLSVHERWN